MELVSQGELMLQRFDNTRMITAGSLICGWRDRWEIGCRLLGVMSPSRGGTFSGAGSGIPIPTPMTI